MTHEQIEGKTKIIRRLPGIRAIGIVESKDDITAGDGAKRNIIPGKAALATRTTCNVFELLRRHQIPCAYTGRGHTETTFLTRICEMVPVEVVVRRVAVGSFLKRNPRVPAGTTFSELRTEFYYKTSGKETHGVKLPCDDPFMEYDKDEGWYLHDPRKPLNRKDAIKLPCNGPRYDEVLAQTLEIAGRKAHKAFEILEKAWGDIGGKLQDFKLEFGSHEDPTPPDTLLIADVVDCDSWRVMWEGIQLSKQGYREGDDLEKVLAVYRLAASLTDRFRNF